jgi:hypothetical protein
VCVCVCACVRVRACVRVKRDSFNNWRYNGAHIHFLLRQEEVGHSSRTILSASELALHNQVMRNRARNTIIVYVMLDVRYGYTILA